MHTQASFLLYANCVEPCLPPSTRLVHPSSHFLWVHALPPGKRCCGRAGRRAGGTRCCNSWWGARGVREGPCESRLRVQEKPASTREDLEAAEFPEQPAWFNPPHAPSFLCVSFPFCTENSPQPFRVSPSLILLSFPSSECVLIVLYS